MAAIHDADGERQMKDFDKYNDFALRLCEHMIAQEKADHDRFNDWWKRPRSKDEFWRALSRGIPPHKLR